MDRDTRWERVELAWNALVAGTGVVSDQDAVDAVKAAYERGETDEFIKPIVLSWWQDLNITMLLRVQLWLIGVCTCECVPAITD